MTARQTRFFGQLIRTIPAALLPTIKFTLNVDGEGMEPCHDCQEYGSYMRSMGHEWGGELTP